MTKTIERATGIMCGACASAPRDVNRQRAHMRCHGDACACHAAHHAPTAELRATQARHNALTVEECAARDPGLTEDQRAEHDVWLARPPTLLVTRRAKAKRGRGRPRNVDGFDTRHAPYRYEWRSDDGKLNGKSASGDWTTARHRIKTYLDSMPGMSAQAVVDGLKAALADVRQGRSTRVGIVTITVTKR